MINLLTKAKLRLTKACYLVLINLILNANCQAQWAVQPSGTSNQLLSVHLTDSKHGCAVGYSGTILKYDGIKWIKEISGTNQKLCSVDFTDSTHGWAVGDSNIILKYDKHKWVKQTYSFPNLSYNCSFTSVNFLDSVNGWISGYGTISKWDSITHIGYTREGNIILKFKKNKVFEIDSESGLPIYSTCAVDTNNLWVACSWQKYGGSEALAYKLNNYQNTIVKADYFLVQYNCIFNSICSVNDSTAWVAGYFWNDSPIPFQGMIFHFYNGKWQPQYTNSGAYNSVFFTDTIHGWAVGDRGLISRYKDYQWINQTKNRTNTFYSVYFTDSLNGWIVGENGIILHTSNGGTILADTILSPNNNKKPTITIYPNPTSQIINIKYQIPDKSTLSIKVIDILGREVAIIFNEEKSKGEYLLSYDIKSLRNGLYFVKLKSDNSFCVSKFFKE